MKHIMDTGKANNDPTAQTYDSILGFLRWNLSEIIPPANVETNPKIDKLKAFIEANSTLWKGNMFWKNTGMKYIVAYPPA